MIEGVNVDNNPLAGIEFAARKLAKNTVPIGRDPESALAISDEGSVSRIHAETYVDSTGRLMLADNSTNGTAINEARIKKQTPVAVHHGDTIRLGSDEPFRLEVDLHGQPRLRRDGELHRLPLKVGKAETERRIGEQEYIEPPRTREDLVMLKAHRKLASGYSNEEVFKWLREVKDVDPHQIMAKARDIEAVKAAMPEITWKSTTTKDGREFQIGEPKYRVYGREYVPIILDGKFKLVYLSMSRRVFTELKAVTSTKEVSNWHVKTELEATHDLSPTIDWQLKQQTINVPVERLTDKNNKSSFFTP